MSFASLSFLLYVADWWNPFGGEFFDYCVIVFCVGSGGWEAALAYASL
ncbi:hypothetical protein [Streptomyces sp. T028]